MRVFITNPNNYLFSHIVTQLKKANCEISTLVWDPIEEQKFDLSNIEIFYATLRNKDSLEHVLHKVDVVIHLLENVFYSDPQFTEKYHLTCLNNLLSLAKQENVTKFVFHSYLNIIGEKDIPYIKTFRSLESAIEKQSISYTIIKSGFSVAGDDQISKSFSALLKCFPIMIMPKSNSKKLLTVATSDLVKIVKNIIFTNNYENKKIEVSCLERITLVDFFSEIKEKMAVKRLFIFLPDRLWDGIFLFLHKIFRFNKSFQVIFLMNLRWSLRKNYIQIILDYEPKILKKSLQFFNKPSFFKALSIISENYNRHRRFR